MLKGKHIILRALEQDDLPRLHEMNNNLEVELAGGGDPPMAQSLARLEAEFNDNVSKGGRDDMNFAIEHEGVFIGICGLFNEDQTAHTVEMGITIGFSDYWGKGYGRDAVITLVDYAFRYRNFHRVWLRTNGRNERAQRAYIACGFVEEGRLRQHVYSDGAYDDLVYMGILRSEWQR